MWADYFNRPNPAKSADFRPADNENSLLILFQFGYTFKGRFINVLGLVLGFVPDLHQTPQ